MIVTLLTEHHLEFLSLKEGCTGLSESTLVKMLHCWKSHALAHFSSSDYDYDDKDSKKIENFKYNDEDESSESSEDANDGEFISLSCC